MTPTRKPPVFCDLCSRLAVAELEAAPLCTRCLLAELGDRAGSLDGLGPLELAPAGLGPAPRPAAADGSDVDNVA